jgi:hypothetical protein
VQAELEPSVASAVDARPFANVAPLFPRPPPAISLPVDPIDDPPSDVELQDDGPTRPSDPTPGSVRSTTPAPRRPAVDWDDVGGTAPAREPYLPGSQGGEDLPAWGDRPTGEDSGQAPSLLVLLERGLELARRDTYTAFVVAVTGALVVLLLLALLLSSC